jgi:putative membrane protein
MSDNPDSSSASDLALERTRKAEKRTEYAENRTDWAEDRTLMANERTFAGWMRTGLAAVGIGLGFHALFGKLEPWWLPRAIATIFIMIGIFIFYFAQRHGCKVFQRLDSHDAQPLEGMNLRLVAAFLAFASAALIASIWLMKSLEG